MSGSRIPSPPRPTKGWPKKKKENEKDPIGHSVFYPTSLPPPPRKPSLPAASDPVTPTPNEAPHPSPPSSAVPYLPGLNLAGTRMVTYSPATNTFGIHNQLGLDLGATVSRTASPLEGPMLFSTSSPPSPEDAFDSSFLSPSSSATPSDIDYTPQSIGRAENQSPPSELITILENWEAFTPDRAPSVDRLQDTDPSIASPLELPLNELIDDAIIAEVDSPTRIQPSLAIKLGQGRDSPAPPGAFLSLSANIRTSGTNPFTFGSPPPVTPGPVPLRQLPWPSSTTSRRASAPHKITKLPSPNRRQTPRMIPSPLAPSSLSPYHDPSSTQPRRPPADLFAPNYSLSGASSQIPDDYFSFNYTPPLNTVIPPTTHFLEATYYDDTSSQIAARHLHGKILHPEFLAKYEVRDELGAGGFGFVCSAIQTGHENERGKEVAVKFILKAKISDTDHAFRDGLPIEAYILGRITHPNIIKTFDLFEDNEFWYLVQEFHGDPWTEHPTLQPPAQLGIPHHPPSVPSKPTQLLSSSPVASRTVLYPAAPPTHTTFTASSLSRKSSLTGWTPPQAVSPIVATIVRPPMGRRASHDLFEAVENQRFTEDQARYIFRQVVEAVAYLHAQGIYHRDLKDENIVIDRHLEVKVIDFGSAVVEDPRYPQVYDQFRGTMTYAAAEILTGRMYEAGPADVWSLGILLAIILTGDSPFPNVAYAQTSQMRWKKWVSPGAMDLITRCLVQDPRNRWKADEMLRHPWLQSHGPVSL